MLWMCVYLEITCEKKINVYWEKIIKKFYKRCPGTEFVLGNYSMLNITQKRTGVLHKSILLDRNLT